VSWRAFADVGPVPCISVESALQPVPSFPSLPKYKFGDNRDGVKTNALNARVLRIPFPAVHWKLSSARLHALSNPPSEQEPHESLEQRIREKVYERLLLSMNRKLS
jgi:hypothetical protein